MLRLYLRKYLRLLIFGEELPKPVIFLDGDLGTPNRVQHRPWKGFARDG